MLATKPSDLLDVGTATPRRSSGFSLNISLKWLWEKDSKQALRRLEERMVIKELSKEGFEVLLSEIRMLRGDFSNYRGGDTDRVCGAFIDI